MGAGAVVLGAGRLFPKNFLASLGSLNAGLSRGPLEIALSTAARIVYILSSSLLFLNEGLPDGLS